MEYQKYVYIVISQTGTLLSRLIKLLSGQKYNHASLSLTTDLSAMYSFGRRHPYNPVWGGFVRESPDHGTFKRFSNTEVLVLALPVDAPTHAALAAQIQDMYSNRWKYHYNYLGLFLGGFRICWQQDRCYYCSEFVRDILVQHNVIPADNHSVIHPAHFLSIPGALVIYEGKLRNYKLRRYCRNKLRRLEADALPASVGHP